MDLSSTILPNDNKLKKNSRKRIPTSCYLCRVKKNKCDRARPYCGTCISKNIKHLCKYEDNYSESNSPEEVERNKLLEEIEFLKGKIKILEKEKNHSPGSIDSKISLNDLLNTLDLVDFSIIESDKRSSKLSYFAVKNLKLRYFGMSSYMFVLLNDPYSYKTFSDYLKSQVENYKTSEVETKVAFKKEITSVTQISEKFSLQLNDNRLPSPFIIRVLVNRFMNYCHYMVPFLSRHFLMSVMDLILEQETDDISILGPKYPSEVSILILMLRISTLTLPIKSFFDKKLTSSMYKFVDEIISTNGTISPSHVELVNRMLLSMDQFRKADILRLKALLFLYIYKVFSPEDEENGSDISILFGVIIQTSKIIGVHKCFETGENDFLTSEELKEYKNIVSCLFYYDSRQSFRMGTPLLLDESLYEQLLIELIEDKNSFNVLRHEFFKIREELMKSQRLSVKVMNGSYFENFQSNLNYILDQMEVIYMSDLKDLENNYKVKNINSLDNMVERVESLYFKTELLFNMYILNSALYVTAENTAEKLRYFSLALGNALIVLKNGYKFANGEIIDFFSEYEILYSSSIWIPMQKVLPLISLCMNRLLDGSFCLSNFYSNMNPSIIKPLLDWNILDFSSDRNFCISIFKILESLYRSSLRLSASFLLSFKATLILKTVVEYFEPKISEASNEGNADKGIEYVNENDDIAPLDEFLNEFFESHFTSSVHDFDFFEKSLTNDLNPFLEANYDSLDSLFEDEYLREFGNNTISSTL